MATPGHKGVIPSPLDTDLYKLTMQCAILKFFPSVTVAYKFTNRTPHMRLSRAAFAWLQQEINHLAQLQVTSEELAWLKRTCPMLSAAYFDYLSTFRFQPSKHVTATFTPYTNDGEEKKKSEDDPATPGDVSLSIHGLWLETILYEIPLLALISEAYFKFVDTDWTTQTQLVRAKRKAARLLAAGCAFSEFGSRRRRDYNTHNLVMQGIMQAVEEHESQHGSEKKQGKFTGTSNVHLAMKYNVPPIGTVAHEWIMGIAALTGDAAAANELALQYWVRTYGRGVLGIALTDTFGTPDFLRAFVKPAPVGQDGEDGSTAAAEEKSYAEVFTGVRQDSGDPLAYLERMTEFYEQQGLLSVQPPKTIIYSDSLNVDKCIQYLQATEKAGLNASFGIGTFFTNDFVYAKSLPKSPPSAAGDRTEEEAVDWQHENAEKSPPLNIVIKLSEAEGRSAVKLSDDVGKNMGPEEVVKSVKDQIGYEDKKWEGGDESKRWTQ